MMLFPLLYLHILKVFLQLLFALGESDAHFFRLGAHFRLRLELLLDDLLLLGQLGGAFLDVFHHVIGRLRFLG